MKDIRKLIDIAMKREKAPLVLKNGNVINVFTEETFKADVAIYNGYIAAVGHGYEGETEIDCTGKYLAPGFIDAHIHIESTLATPAVLANEIVKSGTTTIIADPHEIVNVSGRQGFDYMLEATENLHIDAYFMIPSSVPSTVFETSGAIFTPDDIAHYIDHPRVLGLGEVMNYPGVVSGDNDIIAKLEITSNANKHIDGHAPSLSPEAMQAYAAAQITTEHECVTFEDALEKLRAGLYLLVRQGSAAKNLPALISGWLESGLGSDRIMFCTDDKHLDDIAENGHIRNNIKMAIDIGVRPETSIKMATLNAAKCYALKDLGAIAAGYKADIVIVNDISEMNVASVYKNGVLVTKNNMNVVGNDVPAPLLNSVKIKNITPLDFSLVANDMNHVIEMVSDQIVTKALVEAVPQADGVFCPDNIYNKLVVLERHGINGNIAVAPLKGFGITCGAIATTVAHDSHNIICAGDNDGDIALAINTLAEIGGGYVLCSKGKIVETLPLPVCGLMSLSDSESISKNAASIIKKAHAMGIPSSIDPFTSLSFLALPVIPEIRLTDMGLFDVTQFKLI